MASISSDHTRACSESHAHSAGSCCASFQTQCQRVSSSWISTRRAASSTRSGNRSGALHSINPRLSSSMVSTASGSGMPAKEEIRARSADNPPKRIPMGCCKYFICMVAGIIFAEFMQIPSCCVFAQDMDCHNNRSCPDSGYFSPRCSYAPRVATRPRDVRSRKPNWSRYGS